MNLEKDKILSMKVSQIGLNPNEISELTGEEMEALNKGEEEAKSGRFNKLAAIDVEWADYQPPEYDWEITLPEFCDRFRNFACSRLGLYYDIKIKLAVTVIIKIYIVFFCVKSFMFFDIFKINITEYRHKY